MKKILEKVLNRLVVFGVLLAIQLGWFLLQFTKLVNYSNVLSMVLLVLSVLAVL